MSESEISQWITLARHDEETARLLADQNGYPEIIVYHMHQAVEKFLKALLLSAGCTIRKTHHIDALLSELISIHRGLYSIERQVLLLHTYSSRLRYPSGDVVTRSDVDAIAPSFEEIVSTIRSLL